MAVDNTKGQFTSAASALNYGSSLSTGDVLIFAHQDIYFKTELELAFFAECVNNAPIGTVIGAAGASAEVRGLIIYNYTEGFQYTAHKVNKYPFSQNPDSWYDVASIDESVFGMRRETFNNHNFDEASCPGWHLYAVEMSLYARKMGYRVCVVPIQVHHFSHGHVDFDYYKSWQKIAKKYSKYFDTIYTTCCNAKTSPLSRNAYFLYFTKSFINYISQRFPKICKSLYQLVFYIRTRKKRL